MNNEVMINESNEVENEYNPVISVIIPVYNAEKYVKKCLETIINQSYWHLEIICVDDGSTDHSLELLELFAKKDDRIKILRQKNSGPAAARNAALREATGDYISFVDADDFLEYNAYEILMNKVKENNCWDLVIFGGNVVGESNDYISGVLTTQYSEHINCRPSEIIFREKAAKPFLWLHLIRRELLNNPTPLFFDETMNLGEDQIFQFGYVPRAKNVLVIEDKLYNYRITKNASLMQLYNHRRIKKTEMHFEIIRKVVSEWKSMGYYDSNKDELWTWAVSFIYWTIIDFPVEYRKKYSEEFVNLLEKENHEGAYIILEYEIDHYNEMLEWTINDYSEEKELARLIKKIEHDNYEVQETIKSRAFKIGRLLTPESKRLDLSTF